MCSLELLHMLSANFLIGDVERLELLRDAFSVKAAALRMVQYRGAKVICMHYEFMIGVYGDFDFGPISKAYNRYKH